MRRFDISSASVPGTGPDEEQVQRIDLLVSFEGPFSLSSSAVW